MSKKLSNKLLAKLENKEYRQAFAESFLNSFIATQLKTLRSDRGLSQEQLASAAGMKQSRISALENVNYSSWSISTLQRLASAMDVALSVKFESFGQLVNAVEAFSTDALRVPSFEEEKTSIYNQTPEQIALKIPVSITLSNTTFMEAPPYKASFVFTSYPCDPPHVRIEQPEKPDRDQSPCVKTNFELSKQVAA